MKLLYLANNRIPSEKANSLQIMQMCAAFQQEDARVRLVVPRRIQPQVMRSIRNPFAYYGIRDSVSDSLSSLHRHPGNRTWGSSVSSLRPPVDDVLPVYGGLPGRPPGRCLLLS